MYTLMHKKRVYESEVCLLLCTRYQKINFLIFISSLYFISHHSIFNTYELSYFLSTHQCYHIKNTVRRYFYTLLHV